MMIPSHDGIETQVRPGGMIKVQPSYSDIVWSQSPDKITLTMPRAGLWSGPGLVLMASLGWMGLSAWLIVRALFPGGAGLILAVSVGLLSIPGLLILLVTAAGCLKTWCLERDSSGLTYRRSGLWGTWTRRWPAADLASFYVNEVASDTDLEEAILRVGFRNGRSDEVMHARSAEELRWVAAMLMDPRGERKASSPLILAAEPERRKVDPAIVPATLSCRAFEGGVEVTFLPLLRAKGMWWRLPLAALLGTAGVVAAAVILIHATHGAFPAAVPRIAIAAILGLTGRRIWVLRRWAVVQILDGIVSVRQTRDKEPVQFGVSEVEFVQTFRRGSRTELQFLLRDKPKFCLLDGRPPQELEWASRFLRVAIKGRTPVPETATLAVDAAKGACPVCLEKMDGRVVYCSRCRTPLHEECWSYLGMCATYGCREIRFQRSS
jgi:hypothetical protein